MVHFPLSPCSSTAPTTLFVFSFFFLSSSPVLAILNVSRFATIFLYIITMVQLALAFIATAFVSVQASPLFSKRIAQVIDQSTVKWEAACVRYYSSFFFFSFNRFLIFYVRRRLKVVKIATNWLSPLFKPCSQMRMSVIN